MVEAAEQSVVTRTIRDVSHLLVDVTEGKCAIIARGAEDMGPCRMVNITGKYNAFWMGDNRVFFTFRNDHANWGELFKCSILDDKSYGGGRRGFVVECGEQ